MHKLLTTLTNLHGSMAKPMTKTSVVGLCRLVELVKTVRQTYLRHGTVIARSVAHIVQRLSFQALTIIASAKVGPNSLFYWLYYTKTSFSLKWFSVIQAYDSGLVTIVTFVEKFNISLLQWNTTQFCIYTDWEPCFHHYIFYCNGRIKSCPLNCS